MSQQDNIKSGTAVVGFGKTGKGVLDFLLGSLIKSFCGVQGRFFQKEPLTAGGKIYLFNDTPIGGDDVVEKREYEKKGVVFLEGEDQFNHLQGVGLIILSPGVDGRTMRFSKLREKGTVIISEIELAFGFIPRGVPIIAVTGTNGKSTTVSLVHHLLKSGGINSFLTGNIGTPLISQVGRISREGEAVVVLEVSSFQLEEIIDFRPHIGVILNITPDHLDRYASTGDYFSAKLNLVKNQGCGDYLVLNSDDPVLRKHAHGNTSSFGQARQLWFSRCSHMNADRETGTGAGAGIHIFASLMGEEVHLSPGGFLDAAGEIEKISLRKNSLRGLHNLENILAAVTAARLVGVSSKNIETGIVHFKGLPHRMESVGKIDHVEFINDSKATNTDAALKSISSIPGPMVLILGGKDKGSDFTVLGNVIRERVDQVLLIGQAALTIRSQFSFHKDLPEKFVGVSDLGQAVEKGWQRLQKKGGVVLLAPGCASFDMFKNFEHRGDVFKEEVLKLKRKLARKQPEG